MYNAGMSIFTRYTQNIMTYCLYIEVHSTTVYTKKHHCMYSSMVHACKYSHCIEYFRVHTDLDNKQIGVQCLPVKVTLKVTVIMCDSQSGAY
jgi:hypothetical protein